MYCFSGAHTTTPLSPTPTTNTDTQAGNGQTTTALGLTTLVAGCFIVMAEALYDDTTGMTAPAGTTPTLTQRLAGTIFYVSDGTLAAAGATGDRTHTNGNNSGASPWVAWLVSVQPGTAALTVTGAQTTSATTQSGTILTAEAAIGRVSTGGAGGAYFALDDGEDRGTRASRKRRKKFLEDRARRIREL
jgi:hypothetical protein